jgi:hypothetical protein
LANAFGRVIVGAVIVLAAVAFASLRQAIPSAQAPLSRTTALDSTIAQNAQRMIEEGRRIFRYDTFGDEAFWGDQLNLHKAVVGQKLGGVGPGLSPKMA